MPEQWPPVKAIVFDFDGVIVRQSELFKREGWEQLFASHQRAWELFQEAEKKFGHGRGGDRYDILHHIFSGLYPDESEGKREERVQSTAQEYDAFVQRRIVEAHVDPIDRMTLERLSKKYALYVNSATPKEALEKTIESLRLVGVFKGTLGRPHTKTENFEFVMSATDARPEELMFVGDGDNDVAVARSVGCRFLGYRNEWNQWKEGDTGFPVIRSLEDVENWVN